MKKSLLIIGLYLISGASQANEISLYSISCKNQSALVKGELVPVGKISLSANSRETILKIDGTANQLPPMQSSTVMPSAMRTGMNYKDGSVMTVGVVRGAVPALSVSYVDKAGNSLWELTALGCRDHAE